MALTTEQRATLRADALANPDTAQKFTDGDLAGLADLYNAKAAPAFYIWRESVALDEIMQNGFDWVRVDNLSIGKARIWEWMFHNQQQAINPTKANVRAGIAECWKGTAADNAVRGIVFGHCQAAATRVQKLFAVGPGTSTTVDGAGPAIASVWSVNYMDFVGL